MTFATADLCDLHSDMVRVCDPILRDFGGSRVFFGPVATVSSYEDNALVRQRLEQPGEGRVLVIDGGGSVRRALVGGNLAQLAKDNSWAGIVINGCVRDTHELAVVPIGIRALASCPRKSTKTGQGEIDVAVAFANVIFHAGDWVYADADGLIVTGERLAIEGAG
jgi:regulator of ribonuclease activity A